MPGPGESRPDPSQGITRIEDLPKPKIRCQSRNYRRRPCPRCGQEHYRDRRVRRTLHDLGNPLTGRPRELIVIYSQHCCTRCRKYFNADMTDLAAPGSHSTKRVVDTAVRLVIEDGLRTGRQLEPVATTAFSFLTPRSRTGSRTGGKRHSGESPPITSTGHSPTSRAISPLTSCMTARSVSCRSSITAPSKGAIAPVPRISTKSGPFSPGEWLESLPGSARGY